MDKIYPFECYYHYSMKNNGVEVFKKANKEDVGAKKIIFIARGPEFRIVAKMLEDATYINHITGKPFVVSSILYRNIFKNVIIEIDFPDNELIPKKKISEINVDAENYNLIKIIAQHWYKEAL